MNKLIKKLKTLWWAGKLFKANVFYGFPAKKLKIIGVTGTNGKTTIVTLLYNLFTKLGYKVGLISTVNVLIAGEEFQVERKNPTTPDSVTLAKIFNEMVQKGCTYVFMEVTSHSIDQKRIAGIKFVGGIFTNLTHDHLDYHKDIENYFQTKKKFFQNLSKNAFAISNIDDQYGLKMLEGIKARKYTYGLKNNSSNTSGQEPSFNDRLETKLLGEFNAYNALAVYATAVLLGEDKTKVKEIMKNLEPVEGRFNYLKSDSGITGIIDFAHTPDALENVLKTIKNLIKNNERIITVFGCGGDRDPSKRPIMMKIVYEMSDISIPTADNPRSEKIENIFEAMEKGLPAQTGLPEKVLKEVHFTPDRSEAIKKACELAKPGDYILLAGKGHEKYQEIMGVKVPFNDTEELRKYIK